VARFVTCPREAAAPENKQHPQITRARRKDLSPAGGFWASRLISTRSISSSCVRASRIRKNRRVRLRACIRGRHRGHSSGVDALLADYDGRARIVDRRSRGKPGQRSWWCRNALRRVPASVMGRRRPPLSMAGPSLGHDELTCRALTNRHRPAQADDQYSGAKCDGIEKRARAYWSRMQRPGLIDAAGA